MICAIPGIAIPTMANGHKALGSQSLGSPATATDATEIPNAIATTTTAPASTSGALLTLKRTATFMAPKSTPVTVAEATAITVSADRFQVRPHPAELPHTARQELLVGSSAIPYVSV